MLSRAERIPSKKDNLENKVFYPLTYLLTYLLEALLLSWENTYLDGGLYETCLRELLSIPACHYRTIKKWF